LVVFLSSSFLALGRLIIFLEENSQYFCILQLRFKKKKLLSLKKRVAVATLPPIAMLAQEKLQALDFKTVRGVRGEAR